MDKQRILGIGVALLVATTAQGEVEWDTSFRLRHQEIHDDWKTDSIATTLLGRVTVNWKAQDNLELVSQYDRIWALDKDKYNSVTYWNDRSPLPDPPGGELNLLHLNWQLSANWEAKIGRQVISFDNERHVGSVAFWQNDQTFDAASFNFSDGLGLKFQYSYVNKAHRIFGDEASVLLPQSDPRAATSPMRPATERGNHHHNTHLINLRYPLHSLATISGFIYLIDNETAPVVSTQTAGVRLEGAFKPDQLKYWYTLEGARQKGAFDNPWVYTAYYVQAEFGVQYKSHRVDIGYEYLGEDNDFGFSTSLGTNHKFQGWADVFTRYNAFGGMDDRYISYAGRDGKLRWKLVYHSFDSLSDDRNLGRELDLEVAWRYTRKWEFKLIGAHYQAQDGSPFAPAARFDLSTWMVSAAYNM